MNNQEPKYHPISSQNLEFSIYSKTSDPLKRLEQTFSDRTVSEAERWATQK